MYIQTNDRDAGLFLARTKGNRQVWSNIIHIAQYISLPVKRTTGGSKVRYRVSSPSFGLSFAIYSMASAMNEYAASQNALIIALSIVWYYLLKTLHHRFIMEIVEQKQNLLVELLVK